MTQAKPKAKTPPEAVSLSAIIGAELRIWRETLQLRQDQVAGAARARGVAWSRSTVAAIEAGRRQISLEEFVALLFIAGSFPDPEGATGGRFRRLSGFVLARSRVVAVGHAGWLRDDYVHLLLRGSAVGGGGQVPLDALSYPEKRRELRERVEAEFDAEMKASDRLGVDELEITAMARRLWGRTLTEERDKRVKEQTTSDVPRTLQALRGHVTRALVQELRGALKVKTTRRTR
jgi:transcriptional regulator with XRE-family HTH domain